MMTEKERHEEKYKFKLEIIKIVIDKLLIGIIVAAVILLGNAWLEKYKNILSKERIFYEKKYELINKLQISYKELTDEIFEQITKRGAIYHMKHAEKFQKQVNQVTPYMSDSLSKELEKMVWLLSPDFGKMSNLQTYSDYLEFIDDRFDRLIKEELDGTYKARHDSYNLIDMKYSEACKIGAKKYLEMNYKKWLSYNKKAQTD